MTQSANNDEQVESTEVDLPENENDNQSHENSSNQEQEFDPKARVEFNPEQQKKFNDLYKQVKKSDSRNQMLLQAMEEQNKVIEELKARFNQTDYAEAERVLKDRLRDARAEGDEAKADQILSELIDFKAESKIRQYTKPEKPKQQQQYDPDIQAVVKMAEETDDRGNLIRPWIAQDHPQHRNAMKFATIAAMEVDSELGYVDIPEVMRRIDKAMNKPRPSGNSRAPDPMGGNLTSSAPRSKVNLSPKESEILAKLNANLPKDRQIKPEGYLKWK